MRKVIFLDRDGTIIDEPKIDQQVDDLANYHLSPVFLNILKKSIMNLDTI